MSVFLGKGDGSFAAKVDYATASYPYSVVLGDLDGDGKLDIVAANADSDTVSVLWGAGDGSLAAKADYPTGASPQAVALADLDGDRKPRPRGGECRRGHGERAAGHGRRRACRQDRLRGG